MLLARQAARFAANRPPPEPERFVFVEPGSIPKRSSHPIEPNLPIRIARTVGGGAKQPTNPLPFFARQYLRDASSNGQAGRARPGADPDPAAGQQAQAEPTPHSPSQIRRRSRNRRRRCSSRTADPRRSLVRTDNGHSRAVRSAMPYGICSGMCNMISSRTPQGGGAFGPAIQFDTKGVEFGP